MAKVTFGAAQKRAFFTAAQRAEHIAGKGFLAFEVDGVVARFAGRGEKFPTADVRKRLGPLLRLAALYLAGAKKRIARGKTATPAQAYRTTGRMRWGKDRGYVISTLYASRTKARGTVRFDSSAGFHARAGGHPGYVTGLMLKGLTARTRGTTQVTMMAEGSSIGSGTYFRWIAAGEKGNKRGKKRKLKTGKFVRNQWKLNSVWRGVRVNVIQPTIDEVTAMSASVAVGLHRETFAALAGVSALGDKKVQRQLAAGGAIDRDLYRKLVGTWVKAH